MSNRQVAKNAVYLYLRTIVTTIVGIYTSRVVLQTLGIEDYGLYNVVGGVVGLFGFINGAMSGSTSRFITFELGKGDKQRLHDTFNSAMIVHLVISGIVLILAETVGLWFLYNKLVVPEGRMWAAQWVYQLSIISALLGVTQVPYDAVLIAHERFDVSAYISMFSTFAKLGVLYLVAYLPYDNLVSYAILILLITVLTRMFARFYCAKHFDESKFRLVVNRELLKPMLNFSGWNFITSVGLTVNQQGRLILVNIFLGVVANAAIALSNTVAGAINGLAYNVVSAFSPSIIKEYASGNFNDFEKKVRKTAFLSFLMMMTFSVPMLLNCEYLLRLWLVDVPIYTEKVCIVELFFCPFWMLSISLNKALHAIGRIKESSAFEFTMHIIPLIMMFILLKKEVSLFVIYLCMKSSVFFLIIYRLHLYLKLTSFTYMKRFLGQSIVFPFFAFVLQIAFVKEMKELVQGDFLQIAISSVSSVLYCFVIFVVFKYCSMCYKYFFRNKRIEDEN